MAVGVMAGITKGRAARGWGTLKQGDDAPQETSSPVGSHWFDGTAYKATLSALLFHFGMPLWMWVFA